MIIVKLQGGLGNQMFQYAIGRRLALYHNTMLKLDIGINNPDIKNEQLLLSHEETVTHRKFELGNFNITAELATGSDIDLFKPKKRILHRVKKKLLQAKYIRESTHSFFSGYLKFGGNCYLNGYWQTELYFNEVAQVIRADFKCNSPLDKKNAIIEGLIKSTNAVSLHIRRGDYIHDPATFEYHGACSDTYYKDAIDLILQKVKSPHFFIFSDEPDWVLKNFTLNHPITVVDINDATNGISDLRLMCACNHHIIANSSFSWWGAWLNSSKEKIVVGPAKWFNIASIDTSTIMPDAWYKL